ncbi:glycosyl-transferase for dystroglycan-domain-containing protein [Trametes gibbosa]|nr:glycosyl-transferase for dystroglycan-domain-containing protein [Trametes gibbosa]
MHQLVSSVLFKASSSGETDDVTITTLVKATGSESSSNSWNGTRPISPDHPSRVALNTACAICYVDVHLALSPSVPSPEGEGGRQFNVWRNAARLFARTEFVMMLDVDFAVCTDWRGAVRDALRAAALPIRRPLTRSRLPGGVNSYVKQEAGVDQRTFLQRNRHTLLRLAKATPPVIASFHAAWAPGHNSTDYEKYYSIPPTPTRSAYEPYVITSKRVSWCDERFAGYGGNKAACLFEMYISGVSFYVLSDHFLIHQSHKYEEEARREERKSNRKLYSDFKEEVCLRYLYRYYREGVLHTDRAANAREECKKIKNIAKTVSQVTFIYPVSYNPGN